jgi:hypothetical protein
MPARVALAGPAKKYLENKRVHLSPLIRTPRLLPSERTVNGERRTP